VEKPATPKPSLAVPDEALLLVPDHLPAVVAMADVLEREQNWPETERLLAPLWRRLARWARRCCRCISGWRTVYDVWVV